MPDFIAREDDLLFDIDLKKNFLYDLKVYGVKLQQVDIKNRSISIVPGENYPTFVLDLSNVDILAHITGGLEFGPLQMFNFTELELKSMEIKVEIGVIKDLHNNTAYWQIHGATVMAIDKMRIHTDNPTFNAAFDLFHSFIMMFLKAEENGLKSWVDKIITEYNLLLRTHASFLVPWPDRKHHHLNATIVSAPKLDADLQLVEIAVDGRIFDKFLKTTHVEATTTKAVRVESFPGNQVFIH